MYKYSSTFPVNFDRNSNDEFNLRNLGTVLENNAFPGHNFSEFSLKRLVVQVILSLRAKRAVI